MVREMKIENNNNNKINKKESNKMERKVMKEIMEKEIEFNEGLTISEDGVDKKNIDSWITFILQPFLKEYDDEYKDRKFSFVKVSNLCYDTLYWDGFGVNVNTKGLNISINSNELIKEWVGLVFHSGCGVIREEMEDWLGRYCGGLDNINKDVEIVLPMDVVDFDYEIISDEKMMKKYPIVKKLLTEKQITKKESK